MLLRRLVPELRTIERRIDASKLSAAHSRQRVILRGEQTAQRAAAAIRSPTALMLAAVAGFAGGRLGGTSHRVRALEDELERIERLIRKMPAAVDARTRSRESSDTRDGIDLQAVLANVARAATLVSLFTSSQKGGDPDAGSAPEGVAAAVGE